MHLSKHALTLLRAHYRALLQHAQRAALVAVLVSLGALPSLPVQAAEYDVNSILTSKSDDNQSWGDYLNAHLDSWYQQWRSASGYTAPRDPIDGNSNPDLSNTWISSFSSEKAYSLSYPTPGSSPPPPQ